MAYGIQYIAQFTSECGAVGYLNILRKDYEGTPESIRLQDDAISISNAWNDTESPIVGLRCEFFVSNNYSNYFYLFDLITSTERQYKVQVVIEQPAQLTIFEGFLNVDTITHGYLRNQVIRLSASSYLSKLEYLTSDLIKVRRNVTFIKLIDTLLRETGAEFNIRVNTRLYSTSSDPASGNSMFNLNGINTEAFWESDVEYKNSFDVIESILLPFNCFLYWWDGYWYIESYSDIWQTTVQFVEYQTGQEYTPNDVGTIFELERTVLDVHSLRFKNTSQEVQAIPGNRMITIKFNAQDSLMLNLLPPIKREGVPASDFSVQWQDYYAEIEIYSTPKPILREWAYYYIQQQPVTFRGTGVPSNGIANGVERIANYAADRFGPLMGASFNATLANETTFSIEFTYTEDGLSSDIKQNELKYLAWNSPEDLKDLTMVFNYCLYCEINGVTYFIREKNGIWFAFPHEEIFLYSPSGKAKDISHGNKVTTNMEITASGNSFDRTINGFKLTATIDIGKVCSLSTENIVDFDEGDIDVENFLVVNNVTRFYFVLCGEKLYKYFKGSLFTSSHYSDRLLATDVHYGDFKISTSNDLDYDYIEGSINTDFLNKEEFEFSIGDNRNLNYTNGVLQGQSLQSRTRVWSREGMVEPLSIIDLFYVEKFRMYNATREVISSEIHGIFLYRPFTLFADSKQNGKKFILTEYVQEPTKDSGEITLLEYDNFTEVEIQDDTWQ